jgi:hypothetical protein
MPGAVDADITSVNGVWYRERRVDGRWRAEQRLKPTEADPIFIGASSRSVVGF